MTTVSLHITNKLYTFNPATVTKDCRYKQKHLFRCTPLMRLLLPILLLLLTHVSFCQHRAELDLKHFLSKAKLDTFVYIKKGCSECIPSYENIVGIKDTATIKLLYRKNGSDYLIGFSDTATLNALGQRTSSLFGYISVNKTTLKKSEAYYREAKMAKFQPPCLVVFPYETVCLKLGKFSYKHTSVNRETDTCGVFVTNNEWFKIELEILNLLDRL